MKFYLYQDQHKWHLAVGHTGQSSENQHLVTQYTIIKKWPSMQEESYILLNFFSSYQLEIQIEEFKKFATVFVKHDNTNLKLLLILFFLVYYVSTSNDNGSSSTALTNNKWTRCIKNIRKTQWTERNIRTLPVEWKYHLKQ